MIYKRLLLLAFLSAFLLPAGAHDVWLVPGEGNTQQLVFGHPGELEPYDPGNVVSRAALNAQGNRQDLDSRVYDGRLVITPKSDTVAITVDYDHGIWTEDADENLVNKSKRDVPGYLSSTHQKMYGKTLLGWSAAAARPVGSHFEIVPLANPFELKSGDELPVQILYNSAPLAGAELEMLGVMDLFITNREGKTSLPISDQGFQYILAYHRVKLDNHPDADELKLSANLTFTPR